MIKPIVLVLFASGLLLGQGPTSQPNFEINYRFTNRTGETPDGKVTLTPGAGPTINNISTAIVAWQLSYTSEGFSAVSLTLETAPRTFSGTTGGSTPGGTWSTFGGTSLVGALPLTATDQATYAGYSYYPYLRVNLSTHTGTGTVEVRLQGWKSDNYYSMLS